VPVSHVVLDPPSAVRLPAASGADELAPGLVSLAVAGEIAGLSPAVGGFL
jgi:hypothetical protein